MVLNAVSFPNVLIGNPEFMVAKAFLFTFLRRRFYGGCANKNCEKIKRHCEERSDEAISDMTLFLKYSVVI